MSDQALYDKGLPIRRNRGQSHARDQAAREGRAQQGVTVDEIRGTLLHATAYCGIPAGLDAFKAAHEVLVKEGALKGKAE